MPALARVQTRSRTAVIPRHPPAQAGPLSKFPSHLQNDTKGSFHSHSSATIEVYTLCILAGSRTIKPLGIIQAENRKGVCRTAAVFWTESEQSAPANDLMPAMEVPFMNVRKAFSLFLVLLACFSFPLPSFAESSASMFTMDDFSVPIPADAVPIHLSDEEVIIRESGIYSLSGNLADGSVTVDAKDDSIVYLVLDGVSVTSTAGSALRIVNAEKVILTLADGTVNTFTQGTDEPDNRNSDAVITSACDLTINGTGHLDVAGNYREGISSEGTLRIVSGELSVTSQDDAITGRDAVCIGGGVLDILSLGGDAITSSNAQDPDLGYIAISGGILSFKTGDGSKKAAFREKSPMHSAGESTAAGEDVPSQKGLKAESMILLSAGSLTADTIDDALYSNGSIEIRGGVLELSSDGDGIHAKNTLTLSDGTIHVNHSTDGLEAPSIHLDGGEIRINARNDGMNASFTALPGEIPSAAFPADIPAPAPPKQTDVSDTAKPAGSFPAMPAEAPNGAVPPEMSDLGMLPPSTGTLIISGGNITVISEGDGIDVNGDFTMNGGTLYIRGSQHSENGAIVYDGTFALTGGTLIALGSSGMAMGPSSTTIPGCMLTVPTGGLTVADMEGTSLFTFTPDGRVEHAVIYSDLLTDGEICQVISGDVSQKVVMSLEISPVHSTGPLNPAEFPDTAPVSSSEDTPNLPESIAPAEEPVSEIPIQ